MGLEEEHEMELDLNCSFQDPDYQDSGDAPILSSSSKNECELEESFMSGKGKGVNRKKGSVASGLRS